MASNNGFQLRRGLLLLLTGRHVQAVGWESFGDCELD